MDHTDHGADSALTDHTMHPKRWWAMAAIALGTSLVIMDATIANVALPVVIEDIGLSATEAQWMNAVYALVFASLMLTSGRLGDLYGRKLLFLAGLTLFGASSVVAGAAGTGIILIVARLVQGVGAAMILPSTLSSINAMFHDKDRNIAFAIYGSTIGGMAAVGPLVGGWLATDVSWRWAFWLNIPFVVLAVALALRFLPETRDPHLARGIDVPGTALATLGMAAIVFGLIESSTYGWLRQDDGSLSPIPIALLVGVLLMLGFIRWERHREAGHRPVLAHLDLFRIRSFRYGAIAALIVSLGEFGMLFTLPLLLQGAMGYDALGTGWLMMALAIGTFLVSAMTPRLTAALGQRAVVRIGLILEAIAIGALAVALPTGGGVIAALLFLYGVGVGMATAQLTSVVLSEIPVRLSGEASGMNTTFRQLGSALGVALLGGLLITSMTTTLEAKLAELGVPDGPRNGLVTAVHNSVGAVIPSLRADPERAAAADLAADAMISAAKETTGLAAGILGLGVLATLALPGDDTQRRKDAAHELGHEMVPRA
jgi:EmrB/QacA subfamily drug resistance transporter